jgi:hypothetical protein
MQVDAQEEDVCISLHALARCIVSSFMHTHPQPNHHKVEQHIVSRLQRQRDPSSVHLVRRRCVNLAVHVCLTDGGPSVPSPTAQPPAAHGTSLRLRALENSRYQESALAGTRWQNFWPATIESTHTFMAGGMRGHAES